MTCKGLCVRYKATRKNNVGRYISGQKRCQVCDIYIKWEGLWCPCCGYRVRNRPRGTKPKDRLHAARGTGLRIEA